MLTASPDISAYLQEMNRNFLEARSVAQEMGATVAEIEQAYQEWCVWRDAHPDECAQALAQLEIITGLGASIRKVLGPEAAAMIAMRMGNKAP